MKKALWVIGFSWAIFGAILATSSFVFDRPTSMGLAIGGFVASVIGLAIFIEIISEIIDERRPK